MQLLGHRHRRLWLSRNSGSDVRLRRASTTNPSNGCRRGATQDRPHTAAKMLYHTRLASTAVMFHRLGSRRMRTLANVSGRMSKVESLGAITFANLQMTLLLSINTITHASSAIYDTQGWETARENRARSLVPEMASTLTRFRGLLLSKLMLEGYPWLFLSTSCVEPPLGLSSSPLLELGIASGFKGNHLLPPREKKRPITHTQSVTLTKSTDCVTPLRLSPQNAFAQVQRSRRASLASPGHGLDGEPARQMNEQPVLVYLYSKIVEAHICA